MDWKKKYGIVVSVALLSYSCYFLYLSWRDWDRVLGNRKNLTYDMPADLVGVAQVIFTLIARGLILGAISIKGVFKTSMPALIPTICLVVFPLHIGLCYVLSIFTPLVIVYGVFLVFILFKLEGHAVKIP